MSSFFKTKRWPNAFIDKQKMDYIQESGPIQLYQAQLTQATNKTKDRKRKQRQNRLRQKKETGKGKETQIENPSNRRS